MKTTQQLRPRIREADKNALVVRLERNQMDLMQLRCKLSSYRCEPKTYSLFQRKETIRHAMDSLSRTNAEIIKALKEHKKTVDIYVDRAKKQFSEFQLLHDSIEEYLANCLSGELQIK